MVHLLFLGADLRLTAAALGLAGAPPDGLSAPVEMVLGLVRTNARTFLPLPSTRTLVLLRHLSSALLLVMGACYST